MVNTLPLPINHTMNKNVSKLILNRKPRNMSFPVKVVGGRSYANQLSISAVPLQVAGGASNSSKDLTATILQTALRTGLASRLRAHENIHVDVRSTASGLMEGVFGGMSIKGQLWETPLSLTAEAIEVDVGELLLDYGALISKSTMALKNLPNGHCKIRLTAADLGNFMSHPLLQPIASKAIQGKSFAWDSSSIVIGRESSGAGFVDYEGIWGQDERRYKVRMIPSTSSSITSGRPIISSPKMSLRVSARCVTPAPHLTSDKQEVNAGSSHDSSQLGMDSLGKSKPALQNSHTTDSSSLNQSSGGGQVITPLSAPVISNIVPSSTSSSGGAATVAQGLAQMFTHLQLNLQGIELSKPTLLIVSEGDKPLLEINMKMRIRSIPPLNMEF